METKKEIRDRILSCRRAIPGQERLEYDRQIAKNLLRSKLYRQAEEIYCYVSLADEADTRGILEDAWRRGLQTAVPKVLQPHQMEFYYIQSFSQLKQGHFGVLEPTTEERAGQGGKEDKTAHRKVLVILPGAAFDSAGNRIGYGGGFYDAYLARHPQYKKAALAYSMQCVEQIPAQAHDIRVDEVITERGIYTC